MNKNQEVYAKVTATIVDALERGVVPWAKGWHQGIAQNAATRRPYSGINVFSTHFAAWTKGYTSPGWLTFRQAISHGLVVRKGEHGVPILFMSKVAPKPKKGQQPDDVKPYFIAKFYTVFNLDQLTDLEGNEGALAALRERVVPQFAHDPISECEAIVAKSGARINHFAMAAPGYCPSTDTIEMPPREQFQDAAEYYATLFHELGHWTGRKGRLGRDLSGRFGDHAYAVEELVAELTAAFLCHRFDLDVISRSASYLKSWLRAIKADPSALVAAASAASAAAEFLAPSATATEDVAEVAA